MNADRLMRNMMQGMGMNMMPFGAGMGLFDDLIGAPGHNQTRAPRSGNDPFSALMPHGLMNPMSMMMMDPFQSMQQTMSSMANGTMTANGNNGFSYCSSSVTTYTTDEHGRPQVYQQSNEVKQAPGGVKETKSSVRDSRTGHQELAIGHHLRDKAHIKKKSKNVYTGEEEQAEDLVNLDEGEAETFEQNWQKQARNFSTTYGNNQLGYTGGVGPTRNNRLALASSAREDHHHHHHHSQNSHHLPQNCPTSSKHSSSLTSRLFKKDKKKKKSREEARGYK